MYKHDVARFVQYAVRVWNVPQNFFDPEKTALEGIARTKAFFASIGLPTSLTQIGIGEESFEYIASHTQRQANGTAGNFVDLDDAEIIDILKIAK